MNSWPWSNVPLNDESLALCLGESSTSVNQEYQEKRAMASNEGFTYSDLTALLNFDLEGLSAPSASIPDVPVIESTAGTSASTSTCLPFPDPVPNVYQGTPLSWFPEGNDLSEPNPKRHKSTDPSSPGQSHVYTTYPYLSPSLMTGTQLPEQIIDDTHTFISSGNTVYNPVLNSYSRNMLPNELNEGPTFIENVLPFTSNSGSHAMVDYELYGMPSTRPRSYLSDSSSVSPRSQCFDSSPRVSDNALSGSEYESGEFVMYNNELPMPIISEDLGLNPISSFNARVLEYPHLLTSFGSNLTLMDTPSSSNEMDCSISLPESHPSHLQPGRHGIHSESLSTPFTFTGYPQVYPRTELHTTDTGAAISMERPIPPIARASRLQVPPKYAKIFMSKRGPPPPIFVSNTVTPDRASSSPGSIVESHSANQRKSIGEVRSKTLPGAEDLAPEAPHLGPGQIKLVSLEPVGPLPFVDCTQETIKARVREREQQSSLKRKKYFRPIFPAINHSTRVSPTQPSYMDLTTDANSSTVTQEPAIVSPSSSMDRNSPGTSHLTNISFVTLIHLNGVEGMRRIPGVAFWDLKRNKFGFGPVSEILEYPDSKPLSKCYIMNELDVLVEWPLHLGQESTQRHKVIKSERPINDLRRVEILCKIAKKLYGYIQKEKCIPLDPKKLCIMALHQRTGDKEWTVKVETINPHHN